MKTRLVKADTVEDIRDTDIVKLSRKLLNSVVDSTGVLNVKKMTPDKLAEARVVLGYLNATTKAVQTKIAFFRLVGVTDKIKVIEKRAIKM
jgi:hypothetical protein